ncbi:MAG: META domain-containing protein [Ignavibacteriaceae bacterium]|nr:META domain-containing protein [Ignavibacteriaceae bacterium]
MKNAIFLSIVFMSILTISCSSGNGSADLRIHDIWVVESIDGVTYSRAEDQSLHPTLEIYLSEERFSGNTGCNNLNGSVKVEGEIISFSDIVTTKMFCVDVDETSFLTALRKATKYKIEKMRLYLFDDDKELLVFKKID